jgi:Flp pilus assembly pilin Flp
MHAVIIAASSVTIVTHGGEMFTKLAITFRNLGITKHS